MDLAKLAPSSRALHERGAGLPPSPEASADHRSPGEGGQPCEPPAAHGAPRLLAIGIAAWLLLVLVVYYRQLFVAGLWVDGVGYPDVGQSLLRTGLPYWREAFWRSASGLGSAALVCAAMLAAGSWTSRWLLPRSAVGVERWVLIYATGAGVLAYLLFGLALAGLYQPAVVRALIAVMALAGLAPMRYGGVTRRSARGSRFAGLFAVARVRGADRVWMVITLATFLLAALCALAPETEYDALWYHLELPRRWLATGRPVDDITEYVSLYPLTWELLFGAALAFDGTMAARLVHWSTLPVTAAAAALLARRMVPSASAWLTAAVFVTAPTIFWEATTTYVDLAMTVHAGLGVYALVRAGRTRDQSWLAVAAVQLGLGAATKHLSLLVTAVALGAFVLWHARQSLTAAVRSAALVGATAMLITSPWYARAWHASGNPIFPEMHNVFGAKPPERWDRLTESGLERFKDRFGPRTTRELAALPWDMTMHGTRYGGTFGPIVLAVLPAALLVAARVRMARWFLAGSVAYLIIWASPLSSFQLRFLTPVWWTLAPVAACGLGLVLHRAGEVHRLLRLAVLSLVATVLLLNLPPWTVLHEGDRRGWTGWLTHIVREWPVGVVVGGVSRDAFLAQHVPTYGAWRWIDQHTPRDGTRVLTFLGGDHYYSARPRVWSEAVVARDATWGALAGQEQQARSALERLGITHVMAPVPFRRTAEQRRLAVLQPAFVAAYGEVVYEDGWTLVYWLRPSPETGATDQR